jgi:hypothetical protein
VSGGASGAIFGVYGALLSFLWQQRDTLDQREFTRLFWGASVFAAITIFLGFQIPGIDNGAHIGGFIAGLLAGAALAKPLGDSAKPLLGRYRTRTASAGQWLAGFTLTTALVLMVIGIPSPRYRWSEEVMARGGKVVLITDKAGRAEAAQGVWEVIEMPSVDPLLTPILYALPAQLLAYHTAIAKGTDVDQPRNLAKSVTVE